MPVPPQARLGFACALILALACTACASAGAVKSVRVARDDVVVAPTPTPEPQFEHPLTGVVSTGLQSWLDRPALSLKVENSAPARPQSGLQFADLVYEELAEGGITRFVAVFQSREAPKVGPVRSARFVDADVLGSIGGLFGYAGGVPDVIAALRARSVLTDVGVNREPDAYYRSSDREAPHNLYTSTRHLWSGQRGSPPASQFTFLAVGEPPPPGDSGREVAFSFSGMSDETSYRYDAQTGRYSRFHSGQPHTLDDASQVQAANVVIQLVAVRNSSIVDTNGRPSQDTEVLGSGDAVLLSGGNAYRGRWVRPSAEQPTRFEDLAGNVLRLARGTTWIELLPKGRVVRVT